MRRRRNLVLQPPERRRRRHLEAQPWGWQAAAAVAAEGGEDHRGLAVAAEAEVLLRELRPELPPAAACPHAIILLKLFGGRRQCNPELSDSDDVRAAYRRPSFGT